MALLGWLAGHGAVAETAQTVADVDISVLTPAMEGRYWVGSGVDLTTFIPPYVALSKVGSGATNERLRALVVRERYQAERTLADRLIDRLAEASYRAVHEPIRRKPAGSVQTLSWGDLPEHPRGELMLDVTIRWICLCADIAFTKHYPAISLSWRLLDPARAVIRPTTVLTYHHFPDWYRKQRARPEGGANQDPAPAYPVEPVSESCGFDSVKDAEKNPEVLWGCLGEAYDAALRRLVIDLQKVHTPRVRD